MHFRTFFAGLDGPAVVTERERHRFRLRTFSPIGRAFHLLARVRQTLPFRTIWLVERDVCEARFLRLTRSGKSAGVRDAAAAHDLD